MVWVDLDTITNSTFFKCFCCLLKACQSALEFRMRKFQANATNLKHQLSWKYATFHIYLFSFYVFF